MRRGSRISQVAAAAAPPPPTTLVLHHTMAVYGRRSRPRPSSFWRGVRRLRTLKRDFQFMAAADAAMITAVNSAAEQGLEVVGPANRFGAAVRQHRSPTTPISGRGRTDGRTNVSSSFSFPPVFLFLYLYATNEPTTPPCAGGAPS